MLTKIFNLARHAFTISMGAAVLAACSNNGGSSLAPSGTPSGVPGITHILAAHPNLSAHIVVRSQPAKSKGRGFYQQYISDFGNGNILEFDYPIGDAPIRSITGVAGAQGECTRNGKGTFWVAASNGTEEFKIGGSSPIRVLKPGSGACAIDPATGDLAGLTLSGHVIIFRHARGKGKDYGVPFPYLYFGGYDNKGNLFLDGATHTAFFELVELPKGGSTFQRITTSNAVSFPGGVQWDGRYLTVNDQDAQAIYQYTVSGTTATLEGAVSLNGSADCVQTWIAKNIVLCPDAGNVDAEVYKYPVGGSPIATLTGAFSLPIGAVQVVK